jgi:hypothetical protein
MATWGMSGGPARCGGNPGAVWLWRQYQVEPHVLQRELRQSVRAVLAFFAIVTIAAVALTPAHPPPIPDDVAADGRVTG